MIVDTHPRARKPHLCDVCSRTIDIGETYRRSASLESGEVRSFKECSHCDVVSTWYWCVNDLCSDDSYDLFSLLDGLTEADSADLFEQMRRRWRAPDGTLVAIPTLITRETPTGTSITGVAVGGDR